ncbi:S-crystallin 3-like [Octopus sinensis]|uniref:S-crystallin 3-like n=1 Tax=Octopus sinensis TaxID=2607531 RepID=A0A7E6EVQ4_9MOLL|nr:S-crystallin 3-like [Octopus sinensis]
MPTYNLFYFNGRGRAEICRILFAAAGVHYTDRRIKISEWNRFKNKMNFSILPVLQIDGETQIPQSMAIARYLAREFGFHGKNNVDMARIESICDCLNDILDDYLQLYYEKNFSKKVTAFSFHFLLFNILKPFIRPSKKLQSNKFHLATVNVCRLDETFVRGVYRSLRCYKQHREEYISLMVKRCRHILGIPDIDVSSFDVWDS